MNVNLVIEPHAPDTIKEAIKEGVIRYNIAATGIAEAYDVCIFLKTEDQEVAGGLLGFIWSETLHIDFLWVDKPIRSQGHGTSLLQSAEKIAKGKGCTMVQLETFSFQAPDFYPLRETC